MLYVPQGLDTLSPLPKNKGPRDWARPGAPAQAWQGDPGTQKHSHRGGSSLTEPAVLQALQGRRGWASSYSADTPHRTHRAQGVEPPPALPASRTLILSSAQARKREWQPSFFLGHRPASWEQPSHFPGPFLAAQHPELPRSIPTILLPSRVPVEAHLTLGLR